MTKEIKIIDLRVALVITRVMDGSKDNDDSDCDDNIATMLMCLRIIPIMIKKYIFIMIPKNHDKVK